MDEYTIYCTPEQTKRARELGASIEIKSIEEAPRDWQGKAYFTGMATCAKFPTAEQMIGWLRKKHYIHIRIDCEGSENYVAQLQFINSSKDLDVVNKSYKGIIGHPGFPSPEEATLAAIDAALDHLKNLKQ